MNKSHFTRRKFLSASILSTVGLTAIPNLSFGKNAMAADSSKIRLGFIGVGRQAMGLLGNFMKNPSVDVVAGADVYEIKLDRFKE
ncbi:MAG: gfo/Idh/MocA family oxidoreductase, partial [Algoriphagus sp.]